MSKNTQISELINYISVDGSGNVVLSSGQLVATQNYVSTTISNLVASAPTTLDTLNELATALGNDPNFATTIATSIGTKQAQLNGTGFVKVTGTTVSYDNSTYLTTSSASSTYLALTGGTVTGVLSVNSALRIKSGSPNGILLETYVANQLKIRITPVSTTFDMTMIFPIGSSRNYTYPNVDGTIALTSDIPTVAGVYLPLTGGTLSGALDGTSATFSSSVTATGNIRTYRTGGSSYIQMNGEGGTGNLESSNGYYYFNRSPGDFTNPNLMIDGANNRVGIGTTLPSSKLTISRASESTAYQLELRNVGGISDGNYDGIRFTQGANGLTPLGSIRLKYKSSGYPDLGIFTRSGDSAETERLVILNGGNIGVNTPTPLEKLSVTGNLHVAGVGNGLLFDTDASGRSISQYVTNLYEFHILNARGNSSRFVLGNGSIWLGTSGTPQFYINTSSGNVGMGTADFANLAFGSTLLKVAGTRATLGLQSSGTLSTIALISANNTATAMHLNYENTGAFRWYNYSSATETFTLLGNGRLGLGVSSPDAQLHVGGAILVSNNSQTYRRAITCHGQSGTYSQIKVYFNKSNWGSVTYDIKLASAGGTYHTAGCYYSNPGFSSNLVSINAGNGPSMSMTADSQTGSTQGALWVFSGATMIHPILTIDISCGNGYQVNPDDIVVQFL